MLWIVVALGGFALLMAKMGAMSVWVKVLGAGLMLAGAILFLGLCTWLVARLRRRAGGSRNVLARQSRRD